MSSLLAGDMHSYPYVPRFPKLQAQATAGRDVRVGPAVLAVQPRDLGPDA